MLRTEGEDARPRLRYGAYLNVFSGHLSRYNIMEYTRCHVIKEICDEKGNDCCGYYTFSGDADGF